MPGANVGMINIGEMIGKSMGNKEKKKKMSVKESHEILINDESDKLIEQDKIVKAAKLSTENNGIVFLDEIDKIFFFKQKTAYEMLRSLVGSEMCIRDRLGWLDTI